MDYFFRSFLENTHKEFGLFRKNVSLHYNISMEEQAFLDLIYKSMQESAREILQTLGRPPSSATREEAIKQVAMLKAAKDESNQKKK